tara:strand:+ start:208 stop:348 length:141 start_codon:yes stop_codon:yes gene_type:complete
MYSPYNRKFSFIDSPRSYWLDLTVGYGCLIAALCVFGAIAIMMGVV